MDDRPSSRNRRQHLKNLRKTRKSRIEVNRRALAAPRTGSGLSVSSLLTTLGLFVAAGILILFVGSAVLQLRENLSGRKAPAAQPAAIPGAPALPDSAGLPAVDPATVEVRVLNGCGEPGAGKGMTTRLRDLRYDVVSSGNADNYNYENTVVVNHTQRTELGLSVARAIGCSRLISQSDEMALCDVTVILGRDWSAFIQPPPPPKAPPSFLRKAYRRARSVLHFN